MAQQQNSNNLKKIITIWLGQLVSAIGSQMTAIALEIWAWGITGKATTLALVGFFSLLPSIMITPISGVIVDRFNRKLLMILGDTVAVITTIVLLFLYINKYLQIWHIYIAAAFVGTFNQFQYLAYSASISLMISKQHYTRASSLEFLSHHSAIIIAPALTGYFYKIIGLVGIWLIDISTFIIAISSILFFNIPQPTQTEENQNLISFWQDLSYGLRYLSIRKSLMLLLLTNLLFFFAHDVGDVLYIPMILARTGDNTFVLGNLTLFYHFRERINSG
ncbi:MAG: MFS transporter [Rivularia sp. ALOHA_DT_140]|nr:MFS transporter [Rivularia sp. ALOHA_DT_140]